MTMTEFVGSLRSKPCESQAKNTSALTVRVNNVAVSKQEANNAPMTLVRLGDAHRVCQHSVSQTGA